MNPDYCSCNEFEKAIFYDDIQCFGPEGDRYNAIKKQGWYIFDMGYQRLIASRESFKCGPWYWRRLTPARYTKVLFQLAVR
jgi:hypothetical protein